MFNCLGSTGTRKGMASGSQLYIFSKGGSSACLSCSLVNRTLFAPIGFCGGVGSGVLMGGVEVVGVDISVLQIHQ